MKEWWQQLQLREQKMVMGVAVFIGLLLFYTVIWQPLSDGVIQAEKKLAKQENLLSWVSEGSLQYVQAKQRRVQKSRNGSLSSVINKTARPSSITVSRTQDQGDNIQVWIEDVSFKNLLAWLQLLSVKEGLEVQNIDIVKGEQAGTVQVRRLMLARQ